MCGYNEDNKKCFPDSFNAGADAQDKEFCSINVKGSLTSHNPIGLQGLLRG
jgi:hypothetical protein